MRSSIVRILALTGMVSIAGCAGQEQRWTHPEFPPEHWSVDAAQCRHDALREAERDFFRDGGSSSGGATDAEEVNVMLDQSAVHKRSRALFRTCMVQLGYVSAE
ncbi:MAG: hypothetical protein RIC16_07360 [Rhodospirillales bacterium]